MCDATHNAPSYIVPSSDVSWICRIYWLYGLDLKEHSKDLKVRSLGMKVIFDLKLRASLLVFLPLGVKCHLNTRGESPNYKLSS